MAGAGETDSGSEGRGSESGSEQVRPDGFPEDIPLPEFSDLNTVLSATDDTPGLWSIVLTIDPTLKESGESLMADYGAQLEDAGYEVSDLETGYAAAENEKWTIDFRSAMDGTLTIGTSPN